jgi:hypothetical protein
MPALAKLSRLICLAGEIKKMTQAVNKRFIIKEFDAK